MSFSTPTLSSQYNGNSGDSLDNEAEQYRVYDQHDADNNVRDLMATGRYDLLLVLVNKQGYSYGRYLPQLINDPGFLRALFTSADTYMIGLITRNYLESPEFRQAMITYTSAEKFPTLFRIIYESIEYSDLRQAYIAYGEPDELLKTALTYSDRYPDLLEGLLADQQKLAAVDQQTLQDAISETLHDGAEIHSGEGNAYQQAIGQLLAADLDPNMLIQDKPLFLAALDAHNYGVVDLLLANPKFVMQPDYLEFIEEQLQPLTRIRNEIVRRHGSSLLAGKKRSRYD